MAGRHVALVTGGSRGIGARAAEKLAREGAAVIVASRSGEDCEAVAEGIRAGGGDAWAVALDVRDEGSIALAVEEARALAQAVGPIDWLVNGAGIAVSAALLARPPSGSVGRDLFEEHMLVNFHGARRVAEALLTDMLERRYGRIVHVASSAGLFGYAYVAAYSASKHALVGYTLSAAMELAETGVATSAVCPHYVDSPMTDAAVLRVVEKTGRSEEETRAFFAEQNPGGRLITTTEVADEIHRLLEEGCNGWIVEMDGRESRRVRRMESAE